MILASLGTIKCEYVIARGRIVAESGKLLVSLEKDHYPEHMCHTMRIKPNLTRRDFRIPHQGANGKVRVRAMNPRPPILVAEALVDVPVVDGSLQMVPEEDVVKVAYFNRNREDGPRFVGFLKGFGLKSGAIGTSASWDCYQLVIVGADEDDMALVGNYLIENDGGIAVLDKGKLLADLPLPIGGATSDLPLEDIAARLRLIQRSARSLGVSHPNPFLALQTLSFTSLPYLRITESGLLDVRKNQILDLVVRE